MALGSFSLPGFMARQGDGLYYNFTRLNALWQVSDGTVPVAANLDPVGRADDLRTGANSPRHATQATAASQGKYQTGGGVKFDGGDFYDTGYIPNSVNGFIVTRVTVPVTLATNQFICGSRDTSASHNFVLGIGTGGLIIAGDGTGTRATSGIDYRGRTLTIGCTLNGTTLRVFADGAEVYSVAQRGPTAGTFGLTLGAINTAGVKSLNWQGTIHALAIGREYLTTARFNQIASRL